LQMAARKNPMLLTLPEKIACKEAIQYVDDVFFSPLNFSRFLKTVIQHKNSISLIIVKKDNSVTLYDSLQLQVNRDFISDVTAEALPTALGLAPSNSF